MIIIMVIIVMENTPEKLRGELTRWMLEAKAGVFIGNISATVRESLWKKVNEGKEQGAAMMIYSFDTEQGFKIEIIGEPRRSVTDFEGIFLISNKV
jgi:CRISPR-associated protein Cas2